MLLPDAEFIITRSNFAGCEFSFLSNKFYVPGYTSRLPGFKDPGFISGWEVNYCGCIYRH